MAKRNLMKALEQSGGVKALVDTSKYETLSEEEIKLAAFQSRDNQNASATDKMANDNKRNSLLQKAGFDWFDIDDLKPHPENSYSIDPESIENLAGLIYTSKEIQPLVLRETKDGLQILDGQRRWEACKLLAERYGDVWRMVPAHCHPLGTLSDEEALFILHSNNLGQRILKPSERAEGFKVIADALVEWRKNDESLKGKNTKTYLADHFGVSERTAQSMLNIARNLSKEGNELWDRGEITQGQAEALSKLDGDKQQYVVHEIGNNGYAGEQIGNLINRVKEDEENDYSAPAAIKVKPEVPKSRETNREVKSTNGYLKTARNALRRARFSKEEANLALIGEIKQYIKEIEIQQEELSNNR